MDPAFPDIVGAWARGETPGECGPANDNPGADNNDDEFVEIFLLQIARRDLEATRAW